MATSSSSTLRKVSFSVSLSYKPLTLGVGQTVKYDAVLTNNGNGYDNRTGVFTCPVAGTYRHMFVVDSLSTPDIILHLNVNKITVGRLYVSHLHKENTYVQISRTVIVKLQTGDQDKVVNGQKNPLHASLYEFRIYRSPPVLNDGQIYMLIILKCLFNSLDFLQE